MSTFDIPRRIQHWRANGRENELVQFSQLLSQRGIQSKSRVILIQGLDGIGKTALTQTCIQTAKRAHWHTLSVNWMQNDPQSAFSYYSRGSIFIDRGQYSKALNPEIAEAYNNRGLCNANLNKIDKVLADYEQVLKLDSPLAEVYTNRDLTYADMGQFDKALSNYREALGIEPEDASAIYYTACAFGLLLDESQTSVWLTQAKLKDESYQVMAETDPDYDGIRGAACFRILMNEKE